MLAYDTFSVGGLTFLVNSGNEQDPYQQKPSNAFRLISTLTCQKIWTKTDQRCPSIFWAAHKYTRTNTKNENNDTQTYTQWHTQWYTNAQLHTMTHAYLHTLSYAHFLSHTYTPEDKHTQHVIVYVSLCTIVWVIVSVYHFVCFCIILRFSMRVILSM